MLVKHIEDLFRNVVKKICIEYRYCNYSVQTSARLEIFIAFTSVRLILLTSTDLRKAVGPGSKLRYSASFRLALDYSHVPLTTFHLIYYKIIRTLLVQLPLCHLHLHSTCEFSYLIIILKSLLRRRCVHYSNKTIRRKKIYFEEYVLCI